MEVHGRGEAALLVEPPVGHGRRLETAVDPVTIGALDLRRQHRGGEPFTLTFGNGGQHPQIPVRRGGSGDVDGSLVFAQPLPRRRPAAARYASHSSR